MIDPISASVAICAIIVSILTHIKHSSCLGAEIDTRTPILSDPRMRLAGLSESESGSPTPRDRPPTRIAGIKETTI